MIELPRWIVVVQWVLLAGLALFVIVLYRQFAYFLELKRRGALQTGLDPGERAPGFDYVGFRGSGAGRFGAVGTPALLLFADPGCAGCEKALVALHQVLGDRPRRDLRVLVATSARRDFVEAVEAFRETPLEIGLVGDDVASRLYRTTVTPFAYAIDERGVIRGKGPLGEVAEIERLLRDVHRSDANGARAAGGVAEASVPTN
jgi:hypothetical protein